MANFIGVTGYELYTHSLGGHRGRRGCGYTVIIKPVTALGMDEHGTVVSAITIDLRVSDLSRLDFGQCYALKCPDGTFRFSKFSAMDSTASCWEKWVEAIRGTPEFTALRTELHDLFLHMQPVAEHLLDEFDIKNEFCLSPDKYAAFIARAKYLEAAETSHMQAIMYPEE